MHDSQAEEKAGPITILINCAGISVCNRFEETPMEDFKVWILHNPICLWIEWLPLKLFIYIGSFRKYMHFNDFSDVFYYYYLVLTLNYIC